MIDYNLTDLEAQKVLSMASESYQDTDLYNKLQSQYDEQTYKPDMLYHTINSSDITYFEYNPDKVITTLCQEEQRDWLINFENSYHESKGRNKVGALNGMLFSYVDYATGLSTMDSIVIGTCMRDMGIWINEPYVNGYVVSMIYNQGELKIQDSIASKDEYPLAWFIISGYACMRDGIKDTTYHNNTYDLTRETNRTIYGQKENGNMCMITLKEANMDECQRLCVAMGIINSIVLDGGGSTRFNLFDKMMNTNGYRQIANGLILYSFLTEDDVEYPMRQYIEY